MFAINLLFTSHCMFFWGRWGREWGSQTVFLWATVQLRPQQGEACQGLPGSCCSLPLSLYCSDVVLMSKRPLGRAEALQHRGPTFIKCGFQELATRIASQQKKDGKSQKDETHNHSTSVISSPQMEVCFQQFFLFFLPASQTEDNLKS